MRLFEKSTLGLDFLLRVGDSAYVIVPIVLAFVTLTFFANGVMTVCRGRGILGRR